MKLWYRLKKQYNHIHRKYLSWIMAFGQTTDKTGLAVYKVQMFENDVNFSMPTGINILWVSLRAFGGMFVSGMGTFEQMKVPNTTFLYNTEYFDDDEYYDQWLSYYAELAQLYGAHNDEQLVLYLINEFFCQNQTPKAMELFAFSEALRLRFSARVLNQLNIQSLEQPDLTPGLSQLFSAQGQYRITLDKYQLLLDFNNTTGQSTVVYRPPTLMCSDPLQAKQNHQHYASYYRTYTRLHEFLSTNDDYSASILLHLSDAEKLNFVSFDATLIQEANQFVQKDLNNLTVTSIKLAAEINRLRDELANADVNLNDAQTHRARYLQKYYTLRQLTYYYQFSLLRLHDAKQYQASIALIGLQNKHEQYYIEKLKTLNSKDDEILNALSYLRHNHIGYLVATYAGKYERFFKGKFTSYVSVMNAVVTTILACFSMFKIFAWCVPLAIPITILAGLITAYSTMAFNKNGIFRTYGKFGRTLDWLQYRDRNKNRTRSLITNITFALTAAISAPLYYFSAVSVLLPALQAIFGAMLIGTALSNPIGIAICIVCVASATLATIGLGCSQGRKLTDLFRKYLGPTSALYKKAQKDHLQIFYWLVVCVAVVAAAATIGISIVGDIFGFSAVFNLKGNWMVLPAVISFISSTASDFADILGNFLKLSFLAVKSKKVKEEPVEVQQQTKATSSGTFANLMRNVLKQQPKNQAGQNIELPIAHATSGFISPVKLEVSRNNHETNEEQHLSSTKLSRC